MAHTSRVSMLFGSFGAVVLVACSGASGDVPPPDADESATEPSIPKGGETSPEGATGTPPAASTGAPPAATPPAAKPLAEQCAASADALSCVQCCVADMPPVDQTTCTCDANAACRSACATTLCAGKVPSFACGQCLLGKVEQIQACVEGIVDGPKACVQDAGCVQKAGAADLAGLPLPFDL